MAPKAAVKAPAKAAVAKKEEPKKDAKKVAKAAAPATKAAAKPAGKVAKGGKGKPATKKDTKKVTKEVYFKNLFPKRKKNFSIGQDVPPKRDVTRFVRWPKYVTLQRQKRVLERRLKVPPTLNQFRKTLDSHTKAELFKFAAKYKPENKKQRKQRIRAEAKAADAAKKPAAPAAKTDEKKDDKKKAAPKPVAAPKKKTTQDKRITLKFGIQRVTRLIEHKRAKLVLIAHDVDPIEITLYLPALCKKLEIPYCIVKGKAALGRLVGFKTCSVVCFNKIQSEDNSKFAKLVETINASFSDKYDETRRQWGGLEMGRRGRVQTKKGSE